MLSLSVCGIDTRCFFVFDWGCDGICNSYKPLSVHGKRMVFLVILCVHTNTSSSSVFILIKNFFFKSLNPSMFAIMSSFTHTVPIPSNSPFISHLRDPPLVSKSITSRDLWTFFSKFLFLRMVHCDPVSKMILSSSASVAAP